MPLRCSAAFLLALAGALTISCGGIVDPSQNTIESFAGTVQPASARAHAFSTSKTGELAMGALPHAVDPTVTGGSGGSSERSLTASAIR